ncbi:hypothetical protein LYSHEL_02140 [Lysobacter helvus]|uniref:Dicarboxylate transport domain-containing protein n=2 Tax=Lysobacteraceae TaxID=32033 RepID=A0ABM7Q1Z4_9GAMM|nr:MULTISPECIES: hypothetical protein [Lysobacter]BCT91190.1 hypothetical protein LYSCAS_02140 [Lysobacter caseinilyticus]BCT94343.1 hypothetical protein LYSHEL_02140 [Lysobacter helvus]
MKPLRHAVALLLALFAGVAHARTLDADIARVRLPIATLEGVHVHLDWPANATEGALHLTAARVDAPDLGVHARNLAWTCPLRRAPRAGWQCDGTLRSGRDTFALSIAFDAADTRARFGRGRGVLAVERNAATPDLTRVDLAQVPIAWAQGLLSQAWADARLQGGTLDGRVDVRSPKRGPLQIAGHLQTNGLKLETTDASIAGDHLAGAFDFDYRINDAPTPSLLTLDGTLRGGEFLVGTTYVALPATPVALSIAAEHRVGDGWRLPRLSWDDGNVLQVTGSATFAEDAALRALDLQVRSRDLAPVRDRYLSGVLGNAGLGELALSGALDAHVRLDESGLRDFVATPHAVDIVDPGGRFAFHGLDGELRFSGDAAETSALRWHDGALYGLKFDAASLPLRSERGAIALTAPVDVPFLGGSLRFEDMTLRPPANGQGADAVFGLRVDHLDIGQLATTFGWPAFRGELTGRLPRAHYANERLDFEGGLSMAMFDGRVDVSSLSMERPFGVAPTLAADLRIDDLDLLALTEVFDFGSITGRLDGTIDALRLVDWSVTAFDARLHTDTPPRGVRQRISQRAVQSISSVGDSSFVTTLQGKLIGLFDDFGYRRIGIGCRLANEVCEMTGLRSAGDTFTIVDGAGIPRLTVNGIHRRVDWPTLVERLAAVGSGEVKPVVE